MTIKALMKTFSAERLSSAAVGQKKARTVAGVAGVAVAEPHSEESVGQKKARAVAGVAGVAVAEPHSEESHVAHIKSLRVKFSVRPIWGMAPGGTATATPATPATVEGGCLTAFREEIEAWNPAALDHGERLKDATLNFLDGPFAARALELKWNALELFGVFPGAPRHRFGAQGLVSALAWSAHELTLVALDADAATFRTKTGATLRKPRRLTEPEISMPFWEAAPSAREDI